MSNLIDRVSNVDPDATQWVLRQCHNRLVYEKGMWAKLMQLYTSILTKDHAECVMVVATSNLADIIESLLGSKFGALPKSDISMVETALVSLPNRVSQMPSWGRELVDADLRLHGCILAVQSTSLAQQTVSWEITQSLEIWCYKLRFALQDETVRYIPLSPYVRPCAI